MQARWNFSQIFVELLLKGRFPQALELFEFYLHNKYFYSKSHKRTQKTKAY